MSLLTLFTIPRSFDDQWTVIQKNAIDSWQQLGPSVEIILIGDDEGIAEFASGAGVKPVSYTHLTLPTICSV